MNLEEKIDRLSDSIESLNKSVIELSAIIPTLATKAELADLKGMVYDNKAQIEKRNWALTTLIAAISSIAAFVAGKIF